MSKGKHTPAQRYHDRVAARYDHMYDDAYWAWHDALTWDHLKGFLPTMQRAEVIDLGCGTGKWGLKLLHAGYRVTFVDISGAMVEQARHKVTEIHREDRATFLTADLCDLHALDAGRYVLAVAMGDPIGCSNSPPLAVKQIARLICPGGVLVATFDNILAGVEHYLDHGRLDELAEYLHTGKTHWLTRERPEQFQIHAFSPLAAGKLLAGAGLEVVDMVGKSVLPMRTYRHLLEDPTVRRRLLKLEKKWWRDESAIGRCSHIQIAARKPLLPA